MPYTFFHPGFVLPFAKWFPRFFSIPALIIGSVVPDLDVIYRLSNTRFHIFTYSNLNIFLGLIPIGIVLTYYIQCIVSPILKSGTVDLKKSLTKKMIPILPKIILSLWIAIRIHLFLDQFIHVHDGIGVSRKIGENLGYDSDEIQFIYNIVLYFPQIILSLLGGTILLIWLISNKERIKNSCSYLLDNLGLASTIAGVIFLLSFSLKLYIAGVEKEMFIDTYIICATSGLMSVFLLLAPSLYFAKKLMTHEYLTKDSNY